MTQSLLHTQPTGGLTEMGLAGVWGPELHTTWGINSISTYTQCMYHLFNYN